MPNSPKNSFLGLKIGLVLVLALGAFGLFVFKSRSVALVAAATKGRAVNSVPGTVVIRAEYEQPLVSEVSGRVIEKDFNLELGKQVKKGDILCRI